MSKWKEMYTMCTTNDEKSMDKNLEVFSWEPINKITYDE